MDDHPVVPLVLRPGYHTCPAPECSSAVPDHRYACARDWWRLPGAVRSEIWKTAKLAITNARRGEALVAAATWYREHPRTHR